MSTKPTKPDPSELARAMVGRRWAKTTKRERSEMGARMAKARLAKAKTKAARRQLTAAATAARKAAAKAKARDKNN